MKSGVPVDPSEMPPLTPAAEAELDGLADMIEATGLERSGEIGARSEALPAIYEELRKLAAHKLAGERSGQTLQATALVHEAWIRLGGGQDLRYENRAHFFASAAEAMRRILVDSARRKKRLKRGGEWQRVDLNAMDLPSPLPDDELIQLDEALDRLASENGRAAEVVKLCFFVGLTQKEAADQLGISRSTAERLWSFARAWLFRDIQSHRDP